MDKRMSDEMARQAEIVTQAEIVYRMTVLWFFGGDRWMPAPTRESVAEVSAKIATALHMSSEIRAEAVRMFWERV